MATQYQYLAFISYSHVDASWAKWLHCALERYHPPKGVGAGGRLSPIFRDQSELAASADLGQSIRAALDGSKYLILLCSPASCRSRWVQAEVEHFLASRSAEHILCVIVAGAPGAPPRACLPQGLRDALAGDGEPLAADLRRHGDGRRLAQLKIAAALLGVGLDDLIRRDARRKSQWLTAITSASLGVSLVMAAALYAAVDARGLAQRRSAQSDALVAFMLGDLRQRLVRVGRLDILDDVGRKVLSHYALMDAGALDDMALSKQGEALKLVGSIRLARGDLPGAVQAFGRGATTAHALSARGPNDGPRIFAEAQMIYWLAVVQWRLRRLDLVERGFREYARLADRLVSLDPSRDDWRLETAYARTNLGALLLEQARYGEALSAFMTARAGFEAAASKQPHDADRLSDLVDGRNWTADALYRLGRLDDAYRQRSDAVAMLRRQVQSEPGDRPLVAKTLGAELALSRVALELGRTTEGGQRISAVRSGLAQLIAFDPANMIWLEYAARADIEAAEAAWCASSLPLAMRLHRAAERKIARLKATEGASYRWRPQVEGRWQRQAIGLLHEAGDDGAARQMAGAMLASVSHAPPNADAGETAALAGSARLALGQAHAAFQLLSTHERSLPPDGVDVFAQAAMADGERPLARLLATQLAKIGYRRRPILTYSGIISLP